MTASNNFRTYDQFWFGNEYFKAHSQGGLATPCNDLVKLLEVVGILFRQFIGKKVNLAL